MKSFKRKQSFTWKHALMAPVFALVVSSNALAVTYTFTTLDVPGATATRVWGINDAGQIVGDFSNATGTHGFLDTGGVFTTLDVPGVTSFTRAAGINETGQIVGIFVNSSGNHGFLDTGGSFTTLDVPGAALTQATDHTRDRRREPDD